MLLMWAYANGVASSRIEAACWSDVSFRVICMGNAPDHVTIARFRAAFPGAVESLFAGVLVLCAKLGMGKLGAIALDGTKVGANASKAANRTEETLRKLAAGAAAEAVKADAVKTAAELDWAPPAINPRRPWRKAAVSIRNRARTRDRRRRLYRFAPG